MHISHKAYNIARAAGVAGVLAFCGWALLAPAWLTIAAAGAIAAGVVVSSAHVVDRAEMFAELSFDDRLSITRWIGVAAVAHVGWIAGVEIRPDLVAWWAGGLAALAGLEYYTAKGLEYLMTRPVHAEIVQAKLARSEARQAVPDEAPTVTFRQALETAQLHWLRVTGEPEQIGSVGLKFRVEIPAEALRDSKGAMRELTAKHVDPLAIALKELTGVKFMSDWVAITKEPWAGEYTVSVVTEDVHARVIPYTEEWDAEGRVLPCPITEPMVNSFALDGTPIMLRVDQHGQVVGKSGSGKSDALKRKIAHVLRGGGEVWVCGTRKLYDLLAEWLEPYVGTGRQQPFNWVAYGQQDLLEMYAAGLRLAQYRQNVPLSRRRRWRPIVIVTDESSFPLEDSTSKIDYDGRPQAAASLAAEGTKATKSALIYWWFSGQRGTNDQLGDQGGTLKSNIGFVEVFKTKDPQELGRLLGDEYYKLAKPRHPGQSWIDVGDGSPSSGQGPISGKGAYIQENDPSKMQLHDGVTVGQISWARRDLVVDEPFDEGERAALGRAYARRPRTAEQLIEYLTGELPEKINFVQNAGYEAAWAELEALGIRRPGKALEAAPPAVPVVPAAPPAPAPLPAVGNRKDRIVRMVEAAGEMRTADILDALRAEEGTEPNRTSVMNTLRDLIVEGGPLERPVDGIYRPARTPVTSGDVT
jgi:hypothetical protein